MDFGWNFVFVSARAAVQQLDGIHPANLSVDRLKCGSLGGIPSQRRPAHLQHFRLDADKPLQLHAKLLVSTFDLLVKTDHGPSPSVLRSS